MGKNQDPGSGINIPDPQHWTEVQQIATYISLTSRHILILAGIFF
jgi:hypothetical protein